MNTRARACDPHRCLNCASALVHPIEWEPTEHETWSVLLRCPECEVFRLGVFEQDTMDEFDRELDRGDDRLRVSYQRLVEENMAAEADRFERALAAGAILPEDF
jgi:hypothetical protein